MVRIHGGEPIINRSRSPYRAQEILMWTNNMVRTNAKERHIVGVATKRLANSLCKQHLGKELTAELAESMASAKICSMRQGKLLTMRQKNSIVNEAVEFVKRHYDEINRL